RVVLLSDGLWRRRFGTDPSILGRKITLNDNPYDVIGILPASFWWHTTVDVVQLTPYQLDGAPTRALHSMEVIARLKPGTSFDQARADMDAIGKRLSEQYAEFNRGHLPHLTTLQQSMVGD